MASSPSIDFRQHPKLLDVLISGPICFFIGAGVSKLAGYPTWQELRNQMVDIFWNNRDNYRYTTPFDFNLTETLKSIDPIQSLGFLHNLLDDKKLFNSSIKQIFDITEKTEIYSCLKKLITLSSKSIIVTTNIDMGVEHSFHIKNSESCIVPIFAKSNATVKIYYLHGRIDKPESWIFTTKQYYDHYYEGSSVSSFINTLLGTHNFLFIGTSIEDRILEATYRTPAGNKCRYRLEPQYLNKQTEAIIAATNLRNTGGINTIFFNIDHDGPSDMKCVLEHLASVVARRQTEPNAIQEGGAYVS